LTAGGRAAISGSQLSASLPMPCSSTSAGPSPGRWISAVPAISRRFM
jgi:hypothetical protein